VPDGSGSLAPSMVPADDKALLCAVNTEGKMLVFPVKDLPELPRGKGNKIFGISGKGDEKLAAIAVITSTQNLVVRSGDRKMTIKFSDLKEYRGERAQRGSVLPRGWRKVDRLDVESTAS
jgi:topoisomerase-4 subunit A